VTADTRQEANKPLYSAIQSYNIKASNSQLHIHIILVYVLFIPKTILFRFSNNTRFKMKHYSYQLMTLILGRLIVNLKHSLKFKNDVENPISSMYFLYIKQTTDLIITTNLFVKIKT